VEVTFVPRTDILGRGKKKVVRFPRRLATNLGTSKESRKAATEERDFRQSR
jgi:hypothetical protein